MQIETIKRSKELSAVQKSEQLERARSAKSAALTKAIANVTGTSKLIDSLRMAINDASMLQEHRKGLPLRQHFKRIVPGDAQPHPLITDVAIVHIQKQVAQRAAEQAAQAVTDAEEAIWMCQTALKLAHGAATDIDSVSELLQLRNHKASCADDYARGKQSLF